MGIVLHYKRILAADTPQYLQVYSVESGPRCTIALDSPHRPRHNPLK
jgi:hypothetical protein